MAHRALGESSSIKGSPGEAGAPSLYVSTKDARPAWQRSQLRVSPAHVSYSGR